MLKDSTVSYCYFKQCSGSLFSLENNLCKLTYVKQKDCTNVCEWVKRCEAPWAVSRLEKCHRDVSPFTIRLLYSVTNTFCTEWQKTERWVTKQISPKLKLSDFLFCLTNTSNHQKFLLRRYTAEIKAANPHTESWNHSEAHGTFIIEDLCKVVNKERQIVYWSCLNCVMNHQKMLDFY